MIGNNSCGVHSLMGLGTGRTSDQVHELEILLYDGTRMTVGATTEEELERIIAAGARQGEIYARIRDLRDRYADEIRRRYPKACRAGSRASTSTTCFPSGASMSRGTVGDRGTCVTMLEASFHLSTARGQVGPGAGLSRRLRGGGHVAGDPRVQADRPRGAR